MVQRHLTEVPDVNPRLTALILALAFAVVGVVLLLSHNRWFGSLSIAVGLVLAVYVTARPRG